MAGNPNVRLRFTNRPENVLLVRQTLNGLADALHIPPLELNDVMTAVTEACNNVVLHAYEGREGPLEVELSAPQRRLAVLVRDRGIGIRPRPRASEQAGGGIGLPVIHALAEQVELRDLDGGGTEVEMRFATSTSRGFGEPAPGVESEAGSQGGEEQREVALVTVAPVPVAGSVLPRLLSALAARAYFPTARISDAQTLAEALLSELAASPAAEHLTIAIAVAPHSLELRIGPLVDGRAQKLLGASAAESLAPVLERLSVGHTVAPGSPGETLALTLDGA